MRGAAWLRPATNLFSSRGPSSASPSHRRCLPQLLTGASFRSPWASSGSWQRSAPWIARLSSLQIPARSYRGGSVRDQRPATTKRHLYVVLDNHLKNGFEIHKLDLDDDDLDANSGSSTTLLPGPLPDPPAVRVGPPLIGTRTQFAALGSSIIAMGSGAQDGVTVIYDTKTAELAVSNLLPMALLYGGCDLAVAAGNSLYAFESRSDNFNNCHACTVCFPGGLHCLRAASLHPNAAAAADDVQWNWKLLPKSPWFSWSWNNTWPPELPFDAQSITAHAVHPRGGTIFVSVGGWRVDVGTFGRVW